MNISSVIMLEENKNGRYFHMCIPVGASYEEAEEVAKQMVDQIVHMAKIAKDQALKENQEAGSD